MRHAREQALCRCTQNANPPRQLYSRDCIELIELGSHMNAETYASTIVDYNGGYLSKILKFEIALWSNSLYRIISEWSRNGFSPDCETLTEYMDDARPCLLTTTLDKPVLERRAVTKKARASHPHLDQHVDF